MARKNIQGITIEIGGDTTKLQSALKGVESKLKDTQYALKDVSKLLKMDPGNVELLTQKQKLLTEAIDGTKEKLDTLRDAQEQMAAAGQIDTAEYDALQREIIETEQQLSGLTEEMQNFGSVSAQQAAAAGDKLKEVGEKMQAVGTALTKYVTGPIVAIGTASAKAFTDVDAGFDTIIKKTGASGDALADLEEQAKDLATSMPTDFATVGTAIGEVNTRFGLVGDALEELSGQFIRFAKLNDTDVNSAIDQTQAAMAAFGMDAYDAADALDIINKAAQDTGVNVSKLTSDLTSNSAALEEMGFGFNSATGFIAKLNKNGLDSSTVLAGMKKAMQNAVKEGKPLSTALAEVERSIKRAKTETEAMKTASELFGSKAAPALVKAVRDGRLTFDEAANSVTGWVDSVSSTFENVRSPMDDFKMVLNELKLTGADLVTTAGPMIKEVAGALRETFANVRAWWEGLSPLAQETIVKAAGIAAAVGPVLVIGGKLVGRIGDLLLKIPSLLRFIGMLQGALSGLWATLAANPIGLVIAAGAALVAGFIYLWNTCEGFRDFWKNLWADIVYIAESAWEGLAQIGHSIAEGAADLWDSLTSAAKSAGDTLAQIWDDATTGAASMWKWLGDKLGSIWSGITDKATSVWRGITEFIHNAIERIKGFFSFQWELPHIKLPHFSIRGQFSLNPPQVPHLSIDWYRKAMQDGMILSSPTVLPAANGNLRGYGDAGPEAVVGVSSLRNMINSAVAAAVPKGGAARNLTVVMQIDGREFARAEVPYIDEEVTRRGVQLATT